MLYKIIAVLLLPAVAYDFLTSYNGALSFFNLQEGGGIVLYGLALVVSVTAILINFLTYDLLGDSKTPGFVRIFWFICIVFDFYTALLGLANLKLSGVLFDVRLKNLVLFRDALSIEDLAVLGVGATMIVASPMFAFWLFKKQ